MCGLKALSRVAHPCYFCMTKMTVLSVPAGDQSHDPPTDTTFSGAQIPYKNWPSEYSPSPVCVDSLSTGSVSVGSCGWLNLRCGTYPYRGLTV